MPVNRVFLGWDGPCLPRAAAWLRQRYGRADSCDLTALTVVLPNAQASRRLLEILVEAAAQSPGVPFFPPTLITPSDLPERLYSPPQLPIASELQSLLAHIEALRSVDPEVLSVVVAEPPEADDFTGWLALAQDLDEVYSVLGAATVPVAEVASLCERLDDFKEVERWDAIAQFHHAFMRSLAERGLRDIHAARLDALVQRECRATGDIVLIATADLDRVHQRMIEQAAEQSDRITALIHAPEEEAAAFDALGCLNPAVWSERKIDLNRATVRIVDRPRDQACEIARLLEPSPAKQGGNGKRSASFGGRFAADQITIGVGDAAMVPLIERTLDTVDVPAHSSLGRPLNQSAPIRMLAALANYMQTDRLNDLASLLRHPDIETYVARALGAPSSAVGDWLTLLDRYITEHLHGTPTSGWLGDPERAARLKAVHDAVRALVGKGANRERPLPEWSEPIAAALTKVYGSTGFDRTNPAELTMIRALQAIGDALREQAQLDARSAVPMTFPDAVRFTLSRIGGRDVTPAPRGAAVEVLRWLELQLDDAPALIVTGFNERFIPESTHGDTFLPDHLRRVLGLVDNRRRYARDACMLTAILHSRPEVVLLAGRRGAEEDPLTPSRLLLACSEEEMARRLLDFYKRDTEEASRVPALLAHGKSSGFGIPTPAQIAATMPPLPPIQSLRVTAFRDYIACPYRFYLRHVLKLTESDDASIELDGAAFGSLAHRVLQRLGKSDLASSDDVEMIVAFLSQQLDALVKSQHGDEPPAAVRIQIELLRSRLHSLAAWQASQAAEGWLINTDKVEASMKFSIDVDGEPFQLTGTIDRVDRHPAHGYRILDYKTADTPSPPERAHMSGREWVDLQLPLYALMAERLGITGPLTLGYVNLPKDLRRVGLAVATWTPEQLADAVERAKEIIRSIRRGVFWPPNKPKYDDEFSRICMDGCTDRDDAIEAADATAEGRASR